jgi:transposase
MCRWRRKKTDLDEPKDHALGRSRGGFSTKIHVLCDASGHPLEFHLTPGEVTESRAFKTLMESAEASIRDDNGHAIPWPAKIAGDKAYRANWIDEYLLDLDITPVIPSKSSDRRDARLVPFSQSTYRKRNIIERLIGWLKEGRRIFSRFEKTAKNFAGMIKVAFARRYLRLIRK